MSTRPSVWHARAVVDRVLLEVDAGERRAAARAWLAELVVHAIGLRVVRAREPQLEAARELVADRRREPLGLRRRRPASRARTARAAPPRGSRSPTRGRSRRSAAGRAAASGAAASPRRGCAPRPRWSARLPPGPRCASSRAVRRAAAATRLRASSSLPRSAAARRRPRSGARNTGVFAPFRRSRRTSAGRRSSGGPSARARRRRSAAGSASRAARRPEALAVERRERRIERLERRDVRRPGLLDRRPLDERVELAAPGFDLGQLGQRRLPRRGRDQGNRAPRGRRRGGAPGACPFDRRARVRRRPRLSSCARR